MNSSGFGEPLPGNLGDLLGSSAFCSMAAGLGLLAIVGAVVECVVRTGGATADFNSGELSENCY